MTPHRWDPCKLLFQYLFLQARVSSEQHQKVLGYIQQGKQSGAKAVAGGDKVGDKGYFVKPTVLTNTSDDMSVVKEEIFGPVVCAIPFKVGLLLSFLF
jgi:acyl-CoA reductase-like NAD-dependent aldehyde dehydrogenase